VLVFLTYRASGTQRQFDLADRTATHVGRDARCDLIVDDPRVSRQHAIVERFGLQHLVRDAGSQNGTWLNGHRIGGGALVSLRAGDRIELGTVRLLYAEPGPATVPAGEATVVEWPMHELATLPTARVTEVQAGAVANACATADSRRGLAQAIGVIARHLGAAGVGLFVEMGGSLEDVAAIADHESALLIRAHAEIAWERGCGVFALEMASPDARPGSTTIIGAVRYVAAVPFPDTRPVGVLGFVPRRQIGRDELARALGLASRLVWPQSLRGQREVARG
jgi:hypothetical protein